MMRCAFVSGKCFSVLDAARSRVYVRWRTDGVGEREIISAKTEGVGNRIVPANGLFTDGKESDMTRNRTDENWKRFNDNADEQPSDEFTIDDQLVNSIRETYGIADDETECQLADWQARLR